MFEPIHGSAPKYTGMDKTNPMAMILAAKEGLAWLGLRKNDAALAKAAEAIEEAVVSVLKDGKPLTYDLETDASKAAKCSEVGKAIAARAAAFAAR
jgi:isocitrate/isopropylmalate dehydrogenase